MLGLREATRNLAQTLGTWAAQRGQDLQSGFLLEAGGNQDPRKPDTCLVNPCSYLPGSPHPLTCLQANPSQFCLGSP